MRFLKILNAIRNTFIRKAAKTEPEGNPEVSDVLDEPETIMDAVEDKERNDLKRKIHRYRAFAYHHKKKRIRKKYLKRLLDISPVDRFAYSVRNTGLTLDDINQLPSFAGGRWGHGCRAGYFEDSLNYGFQDVWIPGVKMIDHLDARIGGRVR